MPDQAPEFLLHVEVRTQPGSPILITNRTLPVLAVMADRDQIREALSDQRWDTPGVYTLLGASDEPGAQLVKVGKGGRDSGGVKARVLDQTTGEANSWWDRAVIFVSSEQFGFNSTEIGWLEGALANHLNGPAHLRRRDIRPQGDHTVSEAEIRLRLQSLVNAMVAVMNLVGVLSGGLFPDVVGENGAETGAAADEATAPVTPTWLDAAYQAMSDADGDWTVADAIDAIRAKGIRPITGETPQATLRRDLAMRGGDRFERLGRGRYRVAEPTNR